MKVIDDLKKETINEHVQKLASAVSEIDTDDSTFGETLFNRLLVACVCYKNEFGYMYG